MAPNPTRFFLGTILAIHLPVAVFAAALSFDIPAGPASEALEQFIKQSSIQVAFSMDDVKNVNLNAVVGKMEPSDALAVLLKDTGLTFNQRDGSWYIVRENGQHQRTGSVQGSLSLPGGRPAIDVLITVRETGQSATTDSNGAYSFSSVPAGTYILVINADGYQTLHITDVNIKANQETTLARQTLRKADEVTKMEPYDVNAQTIEQMEKYIVTDTSERPPAFTDRNVDIPRGIDDVQPYYIFNAQTIEQSGATNVEDFLKNMLTMNTVVQSNSQEYMTGNVVPGAESTVNLRGLGSTQTLILIDGRRTAGLAGYGSWGGSQQPDINGVPLAAIDRIEVLPSSASAIYGGSAVGGVINIILKKDYQGGEIKTTYENTADADAPIRTLDATYGFSADHGKTHVMINAHYSDGKPLLTQDRLGLVERGIDTILKNDPSFFTAYGTPFSGATPNIIGLDSNYNSTNLIFKNGTPLGSPITYIPAGAAPGADLSSALLQNAGTYNLALAPGTGQYGLQNEVGSAPREKSFMATIRQDITPNLEAFAEISATSNIGSLLYNPFNGSLTVPSGAPDNPFQENVQVVFPSALSAPAVNDNVTQDLTVGLRAKLPLDWRAELDFTWTRSLYSYAYITYDGALLNADLASGALNPFVDTIKYPLNLSPYLIHQSYAGDSSLNDLALRASGPFFSLPWGRPSLTIGLEHRKEGVDNSNIYNPNPADLPDDYYETYLGQSEDTNDVYAEMRIPLVDPKERVSLVHSLDFQLALRAESFRVGSGTPTYYIDPYYPNNPAYNYIPSPFVHAVTKYTSTNPTAGSSYSPGAGLTLRASYGTAFLPPTYGQLLPNPVPSLPPQSPINDPKTGAINYTNYQTVQDLNQNLKPQNSKDWDLGAIWEPQGVLLKGLRIDLEFFQIKEFNVITSPPNNQFIVDNYPSRVTRDPTSGLITQIDVSSINLFELETEGWDLSFDYRKPTSIGTFDLYALGTIQEHYKQQVSETLPLLEYVGFPSEGGPAKIKANATLTWEWRRLMLGWTTLFFGSYQQAGAPGDPANVAYGPYTVYVQAQGGNTIPSQVVHNVFASYAFGKANGGHGKLMQNLASDWTAQVGIKNLFNTPPPFDAYYQPYFYSPYGDPRLRDLWVSIRHDF